jgi:catechol 2,3-dioxygenase-like lactoylglutathione lyase family enzyme
MISGGNATLYVSDFERALAFYTRVLGLKLKFRAENHWAEVQAGETLVIGIHPATPHAPKPGTQGAIHIGLNVDTPLEKVMQQLGGKGVKFEGPLIDDPKSGQRFAFFRDPDSNGIYLWETAKAAAPR